MMSVHVVGSICAVCCNCESICHSVLRIGVCVQRCSHRSRSFLTRLPTPTTMHNRKYVPIRTDLHDDQESATNSNQLQQCCSNSRAAISKLSTRTWFPICWRASVPLPLSRCVVDSWCWCRCCSSSFCRVRGLRKRRSRRGCCGARAHLVTSLHPPPDDARDLIQPPGNLQQ